MTKPNTTAEGYKTAETLQVGDILISDSGDKKRIIDISRGFWSGSLLLTFSKNDWSCVSRNEEIEVAN